MSLSIIGVSIVKYYFVPNAGDHLHWVSDKLTQSIGQTVQIGDLKGRWDGLHPNLTFFDLRVIDSRGDVNFSIDKLEVRVSTLSLLAGNIDLLNIKLSSPLLSIKRKVNNSIWVSGKQVYPHEEDQEGHLLQWLIQQKQIEIVGGSLKFLDETLEDYSMMFNDIVISAKFLEDTANLTLVSQGKSDWYESVRLSLDDVTLSSLDDNTQFSGTLAWEVMSLRLSPFIKWLPRSLQVDNATLNSQGVASFDDLSSNRISMDVKLNDLGLTSNVNVESLYLPQTSFKANWIASDTGQEVMLSNVFLLFESGLSSHVDFVRLTKDLQTGKIQFVTRDLQLDMVKSISRGLIDDQGYLEYVEQILPGGVLNLIDVSWIESEEFDPAGSVVAQVKFENFGFYGSDNIPGFQGFSGAARYEGDEFLLDIDANDASFDAPKIFSQPLYFSRLRSSASGTKTATDWQIKVSDIHFSNADLNGAAAAYLKFPHGQGEKMLEFQAQIENVDASRLSFYMPKKLLKTKAWINNRVLSGSANNLVINAKGPISPSFFKSESSQFELEADVEGGAFEVGGEWPKVDRVSGSFKLTKNAISFSPGTAEIFGVDISDGDLSIGRLGTPEVYFQWGGRTRATVSEMVQYVKKSPINKMTQGVVADVKGTGMGVLELVLRIPLLDRRKMSVSGTLKIDGKQLVVNDSSPSLGDVKATLQFENRKVQILKASAIVLGGQVNLSSRESEAGLGIIDFQSSIAIEALSDYLAIPIDPKYLSGQISSVGTVSSLSDRLFVDADANLSGIVSRLPSPLETLGSQMQTLAIEYVESKSGLQEIVIKDKGAKIAHFMLSRGKLVRGAVNAPLNVDEDVLLISGDINHLDIDGWRMFLEETKIDYVGQSSVLPIQLNTDIGRVTMFGSVYDSVQLEGQLLNSSGLLSVDSNDISGKIVFSNYGGRDAKVNFDLQRLNVKKPHLNPTTPRVRVEGAQMPPAVDAVVEEFALDGQNLGSIIFSAKPLGGRWKIAEFSNITETGTLTMRGFWDQKVDSKVSYDVDFEIRDLGQYLSNLDGKENMVGGIGSLKGDVSWDGSPFAVDSKSLQGQVAFHIKDGRFLKIKSGAGHIVSLLSLQALPRRITLDFSDVFSSGFSFDSIESLVSISDGVASTDKLIMEGTSASVALAGDVDIINKTQKLEVFVTPKLSSSAASVAGAIAASPAIGLAALLAQKLLGNPFDKIATRYYTISGDWSEPDVKRFPIPAE